MRRRFFTRCARGLVALLSGEPLSALESALAFAGGSFQAVVAGSFNAANFALAMSNVDEAGAPLGAAGAGLLVRAIETGLVSAMDALASAGVSVLLEAGAAASIVLSALVSASTLAGSAGTSAGGAATCGWPSVSVVSATT